MIWIVGDKGMLGTELRLEFEKSNIDVIGSDREVNILEPIELSKFAENKDISAIVNCAAYTAVDKAEEEQDAAERLNAEGPRNLAELAGNLGARFIHISTDYVFHGKSERPYLESDQVSPESVYGKTKAEGEKRIFAVNRNAIVVRTAWLYGRFGGNFVHTMLKLMATKEKVGVVSDQWGSPTWALDLARAISVIVLSPRALPGIYHFTDEGAITWYEFALEISRLGRERGILSTACEIAPLATAQYPTKAKRPAYSVLSKEKIKREFSIVPPDWRKSLSAYFDSVSSGSIAR